MESRGCVRNHVAVCGTRWVCAESCGCVRNQVGVCRIRDTTPLSNEACPQACHHQVDLQTVHLQVQFVSNSPSSWGALATLGIYHENP